MLLLAFAGIFIFHLETESLGDLKQNCHCCSLNSFQQNSFFGLTTFIHVTRFHFGRPRQKHSLSLARFWDHRSQ